MASTTTALLGHSGPQVPSMGTMPSAANQYFPKGTIVTRNASGNAVSPSTSDASGFPAMGVSKASFDNRTGAEAGGTAGDLDIEIDYGVHGFAYTGTAPIPGDTLFVVDNQTVSTDSNGGTRGALGRCSEVRTLNGVAKAFAMMGPHALGAVASLAVGGINKFKSVPLASFVDADGDPLAKFVSASSPTFGFNLADSEALNIRWNNDATPGTALCQIGLPDDLDDTETISLEFLVSKSGATLGDATTLTITAFILSAGDLHDADANCGGVTAAIVGNAAAKTTTALTLSIAAADVPAGARSMTFTVTPTAGLLGTDDLMLHDVRLRYVAK